MILRAVNHTEMAKKYSLYVCVILFVACTSDEDAATPGDVLVYADRGSRQCESGGISPEESAQTLIDAGIDVLQSNCGIRTGVFFPAVCGGGTGEIVVHKIRGVNLIAAEQLGFQPISVLVDPAEGTSYRLVDCVN